MTTAGPPGGVFLQKQKCLKIAGNIFKSTWLPGGKIIQALLGLFLKQLAGIGRLDVLGFRSIDPRLC